ncbi:MAG TPA: hypothetical protein DEA96_17355 [Leptospiraceae bacterium]|nr:hypothetical protein [Spirochaetaceae bacterium]HBS06740.1 hypothetical protein [Leptospiraceae bacterium]|tara:strand:+ start:2137 stop:4575 length:2439 start_codon:yes stop_codon:yes gene_type:complete
MQILFYTRMALYLTAFSIPFFHPGVVVPYDAVTRWIAFVVIPGEMLIAFYMRPPRLALKWGLLSAIGLIAFSVLVISGLEEGAYWILFGGLLAYVWTFLVFHGQGRFPVFAALETFLLAALYYRILTFARSSEEIAQEAGKLTPFLLGLTAALFLIHVLVLYFAAFSRSTPDRASDEQKSSQDKIKKRKEVLVFSVAALAIVVVFTVLVPKDFVVHDISFKLLEDNPPQPREGQGNLDDGGQGDGPGGRPQGGGNQNGKPLGNRNEKFPSELQQKGEGKGQGQDQGEGNGGGQGQGQPDGEGGQGEGEGGQGQGRPDGGGQGQNQGEGGRQYDNKLYKVPSDKWDQFQESGQGKGKQSAVMIIASDSQPIYAAGEYLSEFDPQKGFVYDPDEALNRLRDRRLLETWQDPDPERHPRRLPVDVFYLSSIPQRVLAYRPFSVEPTVLQKKYHPFDLSYTATSAISMSGPEQWIDIPEPTPAELSDYSKYLELNIPEAEKKRLEQWVNSRLGQDATYFARLNAILQGYKDYRYKMGFTEDTSVAAVKKFLFQTREGDCTEFAHATAMLARVSGLPARVVTGYLASQDLQTPAHRGGLKELRSKIPVLEKWPLEQLYLITTSHRHAWVQIYMPGYGWVDIETTSFAIPPTPENDPNAMDVIIPEIEEEENVQDKKGFEIPWVFLGQITGILAVLAILVLYSFRFLRLAYHGYLARKNNRKGLDHILTLFYLRLAEHAQPLRRLSETPLEYASHNRFTAPFAGTYTMLRFKETLSDEERDAAFARLRTEYRDALRAAKKPGFWNLMKRVFTLRGFKY